MVNLILVNEIELLVGHPIKAAHEATGLSNSRHIQGYMKENSNRGKTITQGKSTGVTNIEG